MPSHGPTRILFACSSLDTKTKNHGNRKIKHWASQLTSCIYTYPCVHVCIYIYIGCLSLPVDESAALLGFCLVLPLKLLFTSGFHSLIPRVGQVFDAVFTPFLVGFKGKPNGHRGPCTFKTIPRCAPSEPRASRRRWISKTPMLSC